MSSAEAAEQGGSGAGVSLGRRVLLWLGVVLLALLALVGGLAAAMGTDALLALLSGSDPAKVAEAADSAEGASEGHGGGHAGGAAEPEGMKMLTFDEMIVNITSVTLQGRQTSRFLKTNLALVYDSTKEGAEKIPERQVYMRDGFQDYMRQLTEMDLKGSIGLVELKSELLRRARAITGSTAPQEILVADLIVQ